MKDEFARVECTAQIVSTYVGNNSLAIGEVEDFIRAIHAALTSLSTAAAQANQAPQLPAIPIRRSIQPEYLVCLEDGRKFKSLRRHLRTRYGMSPDEYRAKWGLPRDYPMVAPNYAQARSELAKRLGFGKRPRNASNAHRSNLRKTRGASRP